MKVIFVILMSFLINIGLCADDNNHNNSNLESRFSNEELQGVWIKQDCLSTNISASKSDPYDICKMEYHAFKFVDHYYLEYLSNEKYSDNKDKLKRNYLTFKLREFDKKHWLQLNIFSFKTYYVIIKITKKTKINNRNIVIDFKVGDMILALYNSKKEIIHRLHYRKLH